MKIATWNVNSLKVRLPHVSDWLIQHQPDVLCLQELKLDQDQFPLSAFEMLGYRAVWSGQKTYNGVAILSKEEAQNVHTGLPALPNDPQRRVIAATIGGVRVVDVYCVNGEAVGSEKFAYKQQWFAALAEFIRSELAQYPELVLLGDFNIAPADLDVYDPEKWRGKILCSAEERAWFQTLLDLGLTDSLRRLHPSEPLYTWWDYRMNMFRRKLGLRIDHILASQALLPRLAAAGVDTAPRALERPSDHAPVWAEFE